MENKLPTCAAHHLAVEVPEHCYETVKRLQQFSSYTEKNNHYAIIEHNDGTMTVFEMVDINPTGHNEWSCHMQPVTDFEKVKSICQGYILAKSPKPDGKFTKLLKRFRKWTGL